MSDANRSDPVTTYWDDYLREIGPDARASMRVRRGLDRALVERRRMAPTDAPAQPVPRAAAAFFVIKSSALSVGLALATLGGLHVGARALAPAELPAIAAPAGAAPSIATQDPHATAVPRRSPELPSIEPAPSEVAVPAIAPMRAPVRAPSDAPRRTSTTPSPAPTPVPPAVAPDALRAELALPDALRAELALPDALRAELALMDRAKAALAAGDDAQLLRLVGEHAERFPAGSMIEERRGWTVIARCRIGAATSRSIAESFARDYPRSVLLDDIHHACSQHSSTDSSRASE